MKSSAYTTTEIMARLVESIFDRVDSCLPPCVTPDEAAGHNWQSSREQNSDFVRGVWGLAASYCQALLGGALDTYATILEPHITAFIDARMQDEKAQNPDRMACENIAVQLIDAPTD